VQVAFKLGPVGLAQRMPISGRCSAVDMGLAGQRMTYLSGYDRRDLSRHR